MTTIDWSQAGSSATTSFDEKVQEAAGQIVLGIDDLMSDASVPRQVKLAIVQQLGTILADRQQLQQLLSGQPVQGGPAALGGGNSTNGTPAGYVPKQQFDDLKAESDRADAQNATLLKDRKVLEEVVFDLGLSAPANTNTPFPDDTAKRIAQATERVVSEQISKTGLVRQDDVKAVATTLTSSWGKKHKPLLGRKDVTVPASEVVKIDEALDELNKLVS